MSKTRWKIVIALLSLCALIGAYRWQQIEKMKSAVAEHLTDPDAAKFRNIRFYGAVFVASMCGEVNAKNAFGGYSGYRPFEVLNGMDGIKIQFPDTSKSPPEVEKCHSAEVAPWWALR